MLTAEFAPNKNLCLLVSFIQEFCEWEQIMEKDVCILLETAA